MGLFSKCVVCGKTKLSSRVDRGVCSKCYTKMMAQESVEKQKTIDVSSLFQSTDSDYSPPSANSGEITYVIVDVETTGLNPAEDAIVQISALRYFGRKFVDGLNSYVNPLRPIPSASTAIHGITDAKVKDSPTIDEIKEPFLKLVEGAILVGHNATFDLHFLDHAFHGALDNIEYIDTLEIAKALLNLPNYKLETVADYAEFYPEGGYHDSLTDCTATAAVFFRLAFDKPGFVQTYHSKRFAKADHFRAPEDTISSAPVSSDESTHDFYEEFFEFNTKWVSLDYPKNKGKTATIISQLHCGDPIVLEWSDTPFRDEDHVKVFTKAKQQIGWVPGPYPDLERAVKNRWPINARIKRTGKVQEPGKNIWWAVVEATIKIPCAPGTSMVYMTSYKSRYHLREDCGKAHKQRMPLQVALERGGIPCPHCALNGENSKGGDGVQ